MALALVAHRERHLLVLDRRELHRRRQRLDLGEHPVDPDGDRLLDLLDVAAQRHDERAVLEDVGGGVAGALGALQRPLGVVRHEWRRCLPHEAEHVVAQHLQQRAVDDLADRVVALEALRPLALRHRVAHREQLRQLDLAASVLVDHLEELVALVARQPHLLHPEHKLVARQLARVVLVEPPERVHQQVQLEEDRLRQDRRQHDVLRRRARHLLRDRRRAAFGSLCLCCRVARLHRSLCLRRSTRLASGRSWSRRSRRRQAVVGGLATRRSRRRRRGQAGRLVLVGGGLAGAHRRS